VFRDLAVVLLFPLAVYYEWVLSRGVLSDQYDPPEAHSDSSDNVNEISNVPVQDVGNMTVYAVTKDQPFPIYGWLNLQWQSEIVILGDDGAAQD
jgi:hypothetical protein